MKCTEAIGRLKALANPKNVEGMARFGISPKGTLGVPVPEIRKLAKEAGKDHGLALKLWASGVHEARLLAGMVDETEKVTEKQMDEWACEFDSWDVCDQACMNLFDKVPFAYEKAKKWAKEDKEFVKRAGFALMAALAFHDKKAEDKKFEQFFPLIAATSTDERNFVRKAVNWALRQIGKRNLALNKKAVSAAKEIQKIDSKAAKWIATDAIRELTDAKILARMRR